MKVLISAGGKRSCYCSHYNNQKIKDCDKLFRHVFSSCRLARWNVCDAPESGPLSCRYVHLEFNEILN